MRPVTAALHVTALHVTALLLGVAVGLGSVIVHRVRVFDLPVGLLLALAATFVTAWALRVSRAGRLATSYVAGWLVAFGGVLVGRQEGDYAVAGDVHGYVMVGAALVLVGVGVGALVSRGAARRDTARKGAPRKGTA